jgi:hypothetical protein
MLEYVHLANVGPAPEMMWDLAPRLNLVTGDNGLGKSFLLDVAWWSLTRTWARELVIPAPPPAEGRISYRCGGKVRPVDHESTFDRGTERWSVKRARPPMTGLVLYAQVDGGFSVWDEARNYWRKETPARPSAYMFTQTEIWRGNSYCEGLVRDWASWQREDSASFEQLCAALAVLSPLTTGPIVPGDIRKVSIDDPKRYPTVRMPYGQDVPVTHASAGMRRIMSLAYLLVWAWQEHAAACALRGDPPTKEIIFLIDEIECHLHPEWQRRIVPALLDVAATLTGDVVCGTQLLAVTHSPLVLASVEPRFDSDRDAWYDLDLDPVSRSVALAKRQFVRRGTAGRWLTSQAFDLTSEGRSLEAEAAIAAAEGLLDRIRTTGDWPEDEIRKATDALGAVLPDIDPFWVRWMSHVGRNIGLL